MNHQFELLTGRIEKGTREAAAFDLFYTGPDIEVGDETVLLKTGVTTKFTSGLVAVMKEKSGLSLKGLELKAGVIDADYRQEWGVLARFPIRAEPVILRLTGHPDMVIMAPKPDWKPFLVTTGMKVAQFLLVEIPQVVFTSHGDSKLILKDSIRHGGFGSTGI